MPKRLTDLLVARIAPPESGYVWLPDAMVPSFGARVYATGRRVWGVVRRWDGSTNPTFRKVGDFPSLGVAEARNRARAMIEKPAQNAKTLEELIEEFLRHGRSKRGTELRPGTLRLYRGVLSSPNVKKMHRLKVAGIHRRDISATLREISASSGAPMAALTRKALARLWAYGIEAGDLEYNVCSGTPPYQHGVRSRVLTDAEIWQIWHATEDLGDYNVIVRLLLLLGCRRGEIGSLRWSEIVDDELRIPGSRIKTNTNLILPLPQMALAEISRWPRIVGRDLLFGTTDSGFTRWSASKKELDAKLKFAQPWVLHDLRRGCETRLAELGVSRHVIGKILNHGEPAVVRTYDRYHYRDEKKAALEMWASALSTIVNQSAPSVAAIR
jgi:integrase